MTMFTETPIANNKFIHVFEKSHYVEFYSFTFVLACAIVLMPRSSIN